MVFLPFSQILCISSYIRGELSIFAGGHRKVTGIRYVIETLFIILDRYMKLYIFDHVKLYMLGLWQFSAGASNCEVSSRSHYLNNKSFFSILLSVESTSIPCTGSIGRYQ